MAHSLRFVDSVSASATTRLDLNSVPWRFLYQGMSFAPPPLRRVQAQTMLRDGAVIPASAYDNRVLRLTVGVQSASVDSAATQIQALARELDRPFNVLRWQPNSTQPVYFKTFRSDISDVRWTEGNDGWHEADLEILAEPFGYGERVTLSDVTVTNNPAAVSNPMYWDITGIKGDVEAPAVIALTTATWDTGRKPVLSIRRRGTVANVPHLLQAESMTMGTDTSAVADAAYSGGSKARCTFATSSAMVTRISATHPSTATADARGVYRVFVRIRNDALTTTVRLRTVVDLGGTDVYGPTVTNDKLSAQIMDLGIIQFPASADPVYDASTGTELLVAGQTVGIQAQRASGSDPLDIDYILFIPADDRLFMASWPLGDISSTERFVVDGINEAVYVVNASGHVMPRDPVEVAGGFISLAPNRTNRVFLLASVDDGADSLTEAMTVGVSYHPRYLHVRPSTT